MPPPPFEIRVALIGYVSVGKTTILNALLREKYSEVSMKRTTAGINLFRLVIGPTEATQQHPGSSNTFRSPESTLQEITNDNQALRSSNELQEKVFDIALDEPLVAMKEDTQLVLIDIPGINEAGTRSKYKDYVKANWHTFDTVIVVLDGRQGVNTEEQVALLELARSLCEKEKNVPLIVLLNKIDEPDDEEHRNLVQESRATIERMFRVPDRCKTLQEIVTGKAQAPHKLPENVKNLGGYSPVVIAVSAINAYTYRAARKLSFAQFQTKIDKALIEKLGREACGRRWKRLTDAQKAEKAYQVIQDPDQYQDGLAASQFDEFLAALSYCVGGAETQVWLIQKQIKTSSSRLRPELDFVTELASMYNRCARLRQPVDFVFTRFRELHKTSTDTAFAAFTGPAEVHHLAKPMNELLSFARLVEHMGKIESRGSEIIEMAKTVVFRQIDIALAEWKDEQGKVPQGRKELASHESIMVYGSMLVLSHNRFFVENFGVARLLLEKKYHQGLGGVEQLNAKQKDQCPDCSGALDKSYELPLCLACSFFYEGRPDQTIRCPYCAKHGGYHHNTKVGGSCSGCGMTVKKAVWVDPLEHHYVGGKLQPKHPKAFQRVVSFEVADSPTSTKHHGHPISKFADLLEFVGKNIGGGSGANCGAKRKPSVDLGTENVGPSKKAK